MSVGLLLNAQVVYLETLHELCEGLRREIFINILRYHMGWDIIVFGGDSSEDIYFEAGTFMFEFSTLMQIIQVLSDKWVGSLSTCIKTLCKF